MRGIYELIDDNCTIKVSQVEWDGYTYIHTSILKISIKISKDLGKSEKA